MRHLKEIWVSPYEIAFDPDTNAAASFEGGTITSVDYLTATDVYTYKFEEPVVPETPDTPEVTETPDTPDVPVAPENPDVSKLIPGFEPTKEQTAIFNEIDRQLNEVVIPAAVKYFNLATDVIPQIKNHLYVIQQHIIRFFFGK